MKQRKFVKQLQALGLDRNGANLCAAYSQRNRVPYVNSLARFQWILANIREGLV